MAEYIEREAALSEINALRGSHAMPKFCIEKIPAADVAPVRHERWIFKPETLSTIPGYSCSSCRTPIWLAPDVPQAFQFCPNCGAKMDGSQPETGETEQEE